MTASDFESMSTANLLGLASPKDRAAFENIWLGYTQTWGDPELRVEIAKTYATMKPDNVLCLAGAGEGLYSVARVLLSADDHVIVPTPNYQSAETIPLNICSVTGVPLDYNEGRSLDVDRIRAAIRPNTKLLSLNFPHNPTGMLLDRPTLDDIVTLCREHGIYILCDEVYRGVELDATSQMPQIADIYERGISLNVLSKAYGLPALRIGWIASSDKKFLQKVERYKHYLSICNSGPSEKLAIIAVKAREKIFARNQKLLSDNFLAFEALVDEFNTLFEWQRPRGGCVAFPKYLGKDGVEEFCHKLITDSGILLLPSSIYKSELEPVPDQHFRIGLGRDRVFKDGLNALHAHLEKHYSAYSQ